VDVSASNSYQDAHSGVTETSGVGIDFKLRDPSKDSPAR
jgi:hypothetical protein